MLGTNVRLFAPLEGVSLDELVPHDHFYRHVERTIDRSFVRELVHSCYAPTGRPSVARVVFFRLQLSMFFEGLRSERQRMEVAADRLSLRWCLGYDLHEPLPDHSSLRTIRDRYGFARNIMTGAPSGTSMRTKTCSRCGRCIASADCDTLSVTRVDAATQRDVLR